MSIRTVRNGLFAGLAASVLIGCDGGGEGAPAPKPGPAPPPPPDAQKLFEKPKNMPKTKGAFHQARPPAGDRTGPSRV